MTDNERRERYEAAIRKAKGLAGIFADVSAEVDAATAMADEELAEEHALSNEAINRVRLERDSASTENARLRTELERLREEKGCNALCFDIERERDELLATIERAQATLKGVTDDRP